MALGGHSRIASVGELVQIDRWNAIGGLCSCGVPLSQCEVWTPVLDSNRPERPPVPVAPVPLPAGPLGSNPGRFRTDAHMPLTLRRNIELYSRIQETLRCDVIADASKEPLHFYYLYRSGWFRLVPVLLVREGEGYVDSAVRRGRSFPGSLRRWLEFNLAARRALREARLLGSAVQVRYRDFAAHPEAELERICEAAGLSYEPGMLDFHEKAHHNIAGTRTRFQPGPIQSPSTRHQGLSLRHRAAFMMAGGGFWNRYFGA